MDIEQTNRSEASDQTRPLAPACGDPELSAPPQAIVAVPRSETAASSPTNARRAMLPTSFVRVFEPEDVLKRLRELHGKGYLDYILTSSSRVKLPIGTAEAHAASACDRLWPPAHRITECNSWRPSVRQQIAAMEAAQSDDDYDGRERRNDATAHLSGEDTIRSKRLTEVLTDTEEGWRPSLIATTNVLKAIDDLHLIAPQAESLIRVIANAAAMSAATGLPLKVPPTLLLGGPGIGKTFICNRIAQALGSSFLPLAMNLTPSFGLLAGLSPVWKAAGPGKIATTLLASKNAAPVVLFDELEKVVIAGAYDRPLDVMHSLWEGENAVNFRDEYYDIPFNAGQMISIATANNVEGISPSLLDRLLVLEIQPPSRDQKRAIAQQIYHKAAIPLADRIEPTLRSEVLDHLTQETPRRITRLVALALPAAIAKGWDAISSEDIQQAQALLDSATPPVEPEEPAAPVQPSEPPAPAESRKRFGFIHPSEDLEPQT